MTGMREAKNPNAKAPTKPRRLRRSDDDLDACDGKTEAECNEAAFDGLECEAEDMIGKKANYIKSISSQPVWAWRADIPPFFNYQFLENSRSDFGEK